MNKNKLQLVSFEQAKKLKELGFDWEVDDFYCANGELVSCTKRNANDSDFCNRGVYSAPSIPLALKWFRATHEEIFYSEYRLYIFSQYSLLYAYNKIDYKKEENNLLDELIKTLEEKNGL